MIAMLRGAVAHRDVDHAVVDVNGVGYLVYMPALVVEDIGEGQDVLFHISTQVREDAITLYGFLSMEDKQTFEMLREVNGVGPRTALGILSQMSRNDLHHAISNEEISSLTKLKGLGKKTAERLCLELKNKIPQTFTPVTVNGKAVEADPLPLALARLDYRKSEIDRALNAEDVPGFDEAPVGARLQAALRVLARPM
ncbi:MAG: Holliday junction branch migration protein RuvA [Deltaproteobacteria bacterium]|jgi:Holliday junction DNA helicase RuvA|nr:Holliday junction branch migration protein RuvA [Deltaproteobacteria bacterium]|tara:strand:- start:232 stop:822 length:591 start_codon:yes stop_codon:yes gene_type:complete